MNRNTIIIAALGALLAAGASNVSSAADKDSDKEKCYGVTKAGKNDCAANGHACAAQAKRDADPNEWLYVPKGTCERLIAGSTKPVVKSSS